MNAATDSTMAGSGAGVSSATRAAAEQASWTNTAPEKIDQKQKTEKNWGSAIQLHVKSYPLKFDALLTWRMCSSYFLVESCIELFAMYSTAQIEFDSKPRLAP